MGHDLDLRAPASLLRRHARGRRRRSATSAARGRWPSSATRSPPTTSRPPATSARTARPARWLIEHGVAPADFNSYGSRRGNHEVMVRGTFANVRLRNQLAPGTEGGFTTHFPTGEQTTIYDAAMRYSEAGTPLVVLAGKEYGIGLSRDWAAKGTALLGVRAVLAESFERIHRSNLIGMGVLPLQFLPGSRPRRSASGAKRSSTSPAGRQGLDGPLPARLSVTAGAVLRGRAAHRHPGGSGLLPPRRHPALRPAPAPPALRRSRLAEATHPWPTRSRCPSPGVPAPGRPAQPRPVPAPGRPAQPRPVPAPGRPAQPRPVPAPGRPAQPRPVPAPGLRAWRARRAQGVAEVPGSCRWPCAET